MTGYLSPLLFSFLCVIVADAFVRNSVDFNRRRRMVGGFGNRSSAKSIVKAATGAMMDQLVDHFASRRSGTFKQRFWHNSVYYKRGGPAFLLIDDEGESDKYWVEADDLPLMQMAKSNNAMVFLLEHRYYGQSRPTKDMSTANLEYLTSQQALEDIAAFIKKMNADFKLGNAKWITFGSSYGGVLSAWMRAKYPELVTGSVSSSAPVLAQVNFIEYLEVVQTVLNSYSPVCANNVQKAFAEVRNLMRTAAGRSVLTRVIDLCSALSYANTNDVTRLYDVMHSYYRTAVLNGDNPENEELTIAKICSLHTNHKRAPLYQLADVVALALRKYRSDCLSFDYQGFLRASKSTIYSEKRAWLWQRCTEFGYFRSTDSKTAGAFFGHVLPIDFLVKQCADIFGSQFNKHYVYAAVEKTNSLYGGREKFMGTRVVFTNGDKDPWYPLGMLQSKLNKYKAILIKGTEHSADIYPANSTDPVSLTEARKTVAAEVASWLRPPARIIY